MPIAQILLTDTFDQWRQKDNSMIDTVNGLAANGTVLLIQSPAAGHVLVYDGTVYRNVPLTGDVTISSSGTVTVLSSGSGGSKGRSAFAGSIRSIY